MKTSHTIFGISVLIILFISLLKSNAQENKNFRVTADIVSSYIWRGSSIKNAPNIQPSMVFQKNGFELGFWGSTDLAAEYREGDFWASYTLGSVRFGLTDYNWLFTKSYFNFKNDQTDHVLEANFTYTVQDVPLYLSINTALWGADKVTDDPGKNAYSTYAELGYTFKDIGLFAGFTPADGMYGDGYGKSRGFAFVNLGITGTRKIKITESFSLPVKVTLCLNPQQEDLYFAFGITL
jgi:hypothetical protein